MANHKSAIKEHRQSVQRRERNRQHRSKLRTEIKKFRKMLEQGEAEAAQGALRATLSLVDRSAKHGVIAPRAADRTKSRLTKALARALA